MGFPPAPQSEASISGNDTFGFRTFWTAPKKEGFIKKMKKISNTMLSK